MARMKKATAKKAAPKKMGKRPTSKRPAPKEELSPVPTQQNPQPPMGTPPMGANGPMMKKGGKIKKAQTGVVVPKKNEKEEFTYLRNSEKSAAKKALATKSTKKAQGGTKFGMLSVKAGVDNNPKPTAADRIAGAKGLAKSGKTMKKCKYGCK